MIGNNVEDIQNKIRNKLCSIQIMCDNYENGTLKEAVKQSIQDIIDIAIECDRKIDDSNFDVWTEVINRRNEE